MPISSLDHVQLEKWAVDLGITAIVGFVCTLLLLGKVLHHACTAHRKNGRFLGILVMPPAVLSGILGLACLLAVSAMDPVLAVDLDDGLEAVVRNLSTFVFSALILGLQSSDSSQATLSLRGVVVSCMHEGMPMMVYSQLLIWGQSTICLVAVWIANKLMGIDINPHFSVLVCAGVETGTDVLMANRVDKDATIMAESESLGLVVITVTAISILSLRPVLIKYGWIDAGRAGVASRGGLYHVGSNEEVFGRIRNSRSSNVLSSMAAQQESSLSPSSSLSQDKGGSFSSAVAQSSDSSKKESAIGVIEAGLGVHLSLISLAAFVSFGLTLFGHYCEINFAGQAFGTILTGVRMFKFAMFTSLALMLGIRKWTRVRFNRDWFFLLMGLFLDLVFIAALSKSLPRPQDIDNGTHYFTVSVMVLLMLSWNVVCYVGVARHMFPNFQFERALVLSASAMGNSYCGLLFARLMDPKLQSPVPAAFGAQLLLFFVPASAAKNKVIQKFLDSQGTTSTTLICFLVTLSFWGIFKSHFNYNSSPHALASSTGSDDAEDDDGSSVPLMTTHSRDSSLSPSMSLTRSSSSGALLESQSQISPSRSRRMQALCSNEMGSLTSELDIEMKSSNHSNSTSLGAGAGAAAADTAWEMRCSEPSNIVSIEDLKQISLWVDKFQRPSAMELRYSLVRDGSSMCSLLSQCRARRSRSGQELAERNVLLVEDSMGYIFGCYFAHSVESHNSYYGSGESFIFQLSPTPKVYRWTRANNFFFISDASHLAVGGGGDGFAFQLDEDLDTGCSTRSATYDNDQLSSGEFFRVLNVEVWGLGEFLSV